MFPAISLLLVILFYYLPRFDPKKEKACVGLLPNMMLKRSDVHRSLHPTHSVVASGKKASSYIKGEEDKTTPTPKDGVYGRLKDVKGYILLIGVTQMRNTFIHSIEERKEIANRLTKEPILFELVKEDPEKYGFDLYFYYT